MKKFLLTLMGAIAALTISAETVKFDFTNPALYGYEAPELAVQAATNLEVGNTIVSGDVTITNTAAGSTPTRFWGGNSYIDLRGYKNCVLTVTVPAGCSIKAMKFEGSKVKDFTFDSGTFATPDWTGDAQTVAITHTGTSNIKSLEVTYEKGGNTPTVDPHRIIKAEDSNDNVRHYFYNAAGQLTWETYNGSRYVYTYNEAGQAIKKQTYSWIPYDGVFTNRNYETYEYDANGNLSKKVIMKKVYGTEDYTEDDTYENYTYEDGIAKTWDNTYKGILYYNFRNTITKDDNGNITKVVTERFDPDEAEKGWIVYGTMTYENGYLVKEVTDKNVTINYTYADIDPAYAPANLTAVNNNGDVTLSWDAVAGAQKYVITYDQERVEVARNSYIAKGINLGNRAFAVQPIIEGTVRNASFTEVSVKDEGNLPITDLAVGTIYQTEEDTESATMSKRTFYNIPLTWTLPQGHSQIEKFYIYYTSRAYGETYQALTDNPAATSYLLKIDPFEVVEEDAQGNIIKGLDTPIYVTIIYTTGESDKSNVVVVNPYKAIDPTGINDINADSKSGNGKFIENGGIVILKNGVKYGVNGMKK